MTSTTPNYVSRKPRLLKKFDRTLARVKGVLEFRYGVEKTAALISEAHQQYEAVIPEIPYIGDDNPSLIFLPPSSRCLAVYRALQKQGGTVEEAGKLIDEMSKAKLKSVPSLVRRAIGYLWFSPLLLRRLRKRAKQSLARTYPGDFVFTFIEGDGRDFNYGIDYVECANWKFLKSQGALELMPYICATDKAVSEMLGWGLKRTMTLADGCDKCDFRFKKGGRTSVQCPPTIYDSASQR